MELDSGIMEAINEVKSYAAKLEEVKETTRRMIEERHQVCMNQAEELRPEIIQKQDFDDLPNLQRIAYKQRIKNFDDAKVMCIENKKVAESALYNALFSRQGGIPPLLRQGGKMHSKSKKNRKLKRHRYTRRH